MSEKWDHRFLEMARLVATWSKDPSTQVGVVIVDEMRHVKATGYNGFPRGIEDSGERLCNREVKYQYVVHAELNALLQAGHSARGATLYLFGMGCSCSNCAKHIIQAGIKEIVSYKGEWPAHWLRDLTLSWEMLKEAGVVLRHIEEAHE